MNNENNWFATDAGHALVQQAILMAEPWLRPLYGHNALILQPVLSEYLRPQLQCEPSTYLQYCENQFIGDFKTAEHSIPLVNECMALVYAQFILDTTKCKIELLQEFERILVSEGHLALFNLNAYAVYQLSGKWRNINTKNLQTWSSLLHQSGFEICRTETIGPFWPSKTNKSSDKIFKPFNVFRSVNFILARKRKSALTPLRNSAGKVALAREIVQ
jgi:hypothetical protein